MNFDTVYITASLVAGCYSFFLLILCACRKNLTLEREMNSLFLINYLIGFYFVTIFISSFSKSIKKVSRVFALIFFIALVLLFIASYNKAILIFELPVKNSPDIVIYSTAAIVLVPLVLHFLRAIIGIIYTAILFLSLAAKLLPFLYILRIARKEESA